MIGSAKAGYTCIMLSLLIFPPLMGLAGFILGIVNASKGDKHGAWQIILSVVCAYVGMVLGVMIFEK